MTPQNSKTAGGAPTRVGLDGALSTCRGALASIVVFSLFINLLLLAVPLYMLQIYDRVLSSRSEQTLILLTLITVGLLLVLGLLEIVRSRVLVRTGVRLDSNLKTRIFSATFKRSLSIPGGGQAQALRDLDAVRQFMTGPGLIAFADAPWIPLFIAVGFLFHPWLGFISLGGAVIIFILAITNEFLTRKPLGDASRLQLGANSFVDASLRNAEALQAMGMMSGVMQRWVKRHQYMLALQARASDRAGVILGMTKFVRLTLQVAVLGVGAFLVLQAEITPGTMIAASIIMARALAPVEVAVSQWRAFVGARTAYSRLKELLVRFPEEGERLSLPKPTGELVTERLYVMPPGSQVPALKGVGFQLAAGQTLGVIGPSAAGKSTLARILVGVWPIASGSVRLDGAELSHWNPDELGPHIGYLPQDVELFEGTVAENIARFSDFDTDTVIAAAKQAGVHDMVQRLSDGYSTQIGSGGNALSGGQRQRIALARALYGDPVLIVLDEPNAALDTEGEKALVQVLADLKQDGKTVVLITHRPALLASSDRVLVLQNGEIESLGNREEVMARYSKRAAVAEAGATGHPQVTQLRRT